MIKRWWVIKPPFGAVHGTLNAVIQIKVKVFAQRSEFVTFCKRHPSPLEQKPNGLVVGIRVVEGPKKFDHVINIDSLGEAHVNIGNELDSTSVCRSYDDIDQSAFDVSDIYFFG